jgi:hypothetical protein
VSAQVVELSTGTHRVADELRRHSLSDGEGGHYSTNLDRNRYGSDNNYLFTGGWGAAACLPPASQLCLCLFTGGGRCHLPAACWAAVPLGSCAHGACCSCFLVVGVGGRQGAPALLWGRLLSGASRFGARVRSVTGSGRCSGGAAREDHSPSSLARLPAQPSRLPRSLPSRHL